jgi:hypothetical protein
MSYNGPPPTSSGKDKVGKLCLTTSHHGPVVARIKSEHYVLQQATTTSSGKDKVGQFCLTSGHHRHVVVMIR